MRAGLLVERVWDLRYRDLDRSQEVSGHGTGLWRPVAVCGRTSCVLRLGNGTLAPDTAGRRRPGRSRVRVQRAVRRWTRESDRDAAACQGAQGAPRRAHRPARPGRDAVHGAGSHPGRQGACRRRRCSPTRPEARRSRRPCRNDHRRRARAVRRPGWTQARCGARRLRHRPTRQGRARCRRLDRWLHRRPVAARRAPCLRSRRGSRSARRVVASRRARHVDGAHQRAGAHAAGHGLHRRCP